MGVGESSAKNLPNMQARLAFDNFVQAASAVPESSRKSKKYRRLVKVIYDSLKRIPPQALEIGFVVTGPTVR